MKEEFIVNEIKEDEIEMTPEMEEELSNGKGEENE